jgi:hypothetical protein
MESDAVQSIIRKLKQTGKLDLEGDALGAQKTRGVGDDGSTLDPPAGRLAVESLDHPIDELADLPVEPPFVAEENAEHLGKREDYLAVGQQIRGVGASPRPP